MKTKNQTEQSLLELAITKAANEDGINPPGTRDGTQQARNQAWSPKEVWLTRVKAPTSYKRPEPAQF
jgi:hypothetical protein